MFVGDFNQTLGPTDKLGPPSSYIPGATCFQQLLNDLDLYEIPSFGPHFTWTNNRKGNDCTFERLDRSFCNGEWSVLDLNISVTNLPIHGSDHSPILLFTSKVGFLKRRRFKFKQFWTTYEHCRSIVHTSWQEDFAGSPLFKVVKKLHLVRGNLINWSKHGIGNLAQRISSTSSLLSDIQQALPTNKDFAQEAVVRNQLETLLALEEIYRAQRAKIHFLSLGDKNTSFFHKVSKIRKQGSYVSGILRPDGTWTDKEDEVNSIVLDHFRNIYMDPNPSLNLEEWDGWDSFDKRLSTDDLAWLNRPFSAHEIHKAAFQIGASKAPGPDGFSGAFFHAY